MSSKVKMENNTRNQYCDKKHIWRSAYAECQEDIVVPLSKTILIQESNITLAEVPALAASFNDTTYYIPEDVIIVLNLRYHIIMPILVAMTLLTNTLALVVARRMNSKKFVHVNTYIKIMCIVEICYAMALIPTLMDTEFCTYKSFIFAFYQSYFVQPGAYYFRHISIYLLVNLSLDRFLAIWFHRSFEFIKRFSIKRFVIFWIWISISIVPHILLGNISQLKSQEWLATRGYRNLNHPWLKTYKAYVIISFVVLPSILLIFLSIGMIIGIKKKVLNSKIRRNSIVESKNRHKTNTFAVLASNAFYVGCIIPFTLLIGIYKVEEGGCYSNITQEKTKTVAFCFLMLWVIFNPMVFFIIHREYRKQLKAVFCQMETKKRTINNRYYI